MTNLQKLLDERVAHVRHYLHLQIGKPSSPNLISAPEISLNGLQADMTAALAAARPAQPTREEIAKALALTFHGDLGEWQGFLSKADAFTSALSGDVSKPSYCALCDLEHQLHEDAQGFHHVIKGERVACSSALHEGEK